MKIQRLTIHNIASIVDATVEFDKAPLASDPLFLITGETGSGKTTILNAICLALYNTAPNIESIGTADNDAEGVKTNNPRQLMRRGTGEASVELTFEGNDDKHYIICWNLQRAYRKSTGAMQPVRRTLYCKESDTTLQRDGEIKQAIQDVVGLTFEQFCRTTLLAQGQFSKFMNSQEKDKAEILEKLTGTELYTRIGKKVFEFYRGKKMEFDLLNAEINAAALLSEEEKSACRQEIQIWTEHKGKWEEEYKKLDAQFKWLDEYKRKTEVLQNGKADLQTLLDRRNSDEMKHHSETLRMWDATTEIRNLVRTETDNSHKLESEQKALSDKADDYASMLAGIQALADSRNQIQQSIGELNAQLKEDAAYEPMFEAASLIETHIGTIRQKTTDIQSHQETISNAEKNIQHAAEKIKSLESASAEADKALADRQEERDRLAAECADIDITALTNAVSADNNKISKIDKALNNIKIYRERLNDFNQAEESLKEVNEHITQQNGIKSENARQLPDAKREHESLENQYKGKLDLRDHIIELRGRFSETEICPLCGSHVDGLHTDEILDDAVLAAKQAADNAKNIYDKIREEVNKAEAALKQLATERKRAEAALAAKKKALLETEEAVLETTALLQIDYKNEKAADILGNMKIAIETQKTSDEKELRQAQDKIKEKDKAEQLLTKARKTAEEAKKAYNDETEKVKRLQQKIDTQQELAKQCETDRNNELSKLKEKVLLPVDWEHADLTQLNKTIQELTAGHSRRKTELADNNSKAERLSVEIQTAEETLSPLENVFEKPADIKAEEMPGLGGKVRSLVNEVNQLQGGIHNIQSTLTNTREAISEYYETHPEFTREQVNGLLLLSAQTIDSYREEAEQLNAEITRKSGAIDQLKTQLDNHLAAKPDMDEDATTESLAAEKERIGDEQKKAEENIVSNRTKLDEDAKRSKAVETKKAQLEAIRHEKDKWEVLDTAFGGAQGDKFKKIAQSYVLRTLLHKANFYLRMLSNRYKLECADGSLTINVIDSHQGDAIRNVGLLSGGEGFIVSLALALGLSAISKDKINVDTLFIDEGFGTLSNEYLETVIDTLDKLHQIGGRRVGVISHVSELAGRIHTQIRLVRTGPSSSKVEVVSD